MSDTKTDRNHSLQATEFMWDTAGPTEVHAYVASKLGHWIKKSGAKSLLDIGCGNGSLTARLCRRGMRCAGMDMSLSGLALARHNYPDIDFFESSLDSPLPDKHRHSYDLVISVEVIEHLLLPRQLFERAREALKPGGTLIVTTPYHGYVKNLALALCGKFDQHWHPLRDYGHVKFFSSKTLRLLFNEQRFSIDEEARAGRIPIFARSMLMRGTISNTST
jgi:2-polyprenyl-3-methyl-5-hydroxy-6-metoxy-1,4-benzoquinol methylase